MHKAKIEVGDVARHSGLPSTRPWVQASALHKIGTLVFVQPEHLGNGDGPATTSSVSSLPHRVRVKAEVKISKDEMAAKDYR